MPPYGKLAAIIVSGANRDQTENVAVRLGARRAEYRLYFNGWGQRRRRFTCCAADIVTGCWSKLQKT